MIDRQQLAEALARLDPRDREILYLSLRRRVPDDDLAEVFGGDAGEVARMRAGAVERLSNDMGVQRGADLGHMLKELLDPSTWQIKPANGADTRAPGEGHRPVGATQRGDPPETVPEPEPEPDAQRAPVLDMLEERSVPEGSTAGIRQRPAGLRRLAVPVAVAVALLVPAGVVAALTSSESSTDGEGAASDTRIFEPQSEPMGQPFPSDPKAVGRYPVVRLERKTVLYTEPGGKSKVRIEAKTEWNSPRVLSVVERRDGWLAVLAPELENGEVGWIEEGVAQRVESVSYSVHADLSKRQIVVRRGDRVVRRLKVGVGRSTNPTPPGRYAVTDKLRVSDPGSPYGCCVVALTGHQVKLPEGWPGGDRLAVHATKDTSGLGQAVSLGCMRADPKDARWLLETLPLGTPVFIRA
ncbi:MAG: L,D-transpeptidase family protein [Thermoleophilaceae bacterium]